MGRLTNQKRYTSAGHDPADFDHLCVVHLQSCDSRLARVRQSLDLERALVGPAKVVAPSLSAGVKQPSGSPRSPAWNFRESPFVSIAARASEGQIGQFTGSACTSRYDVIDLEEGCLPKGWEKAVFATIPGPRRDDSTHSSGNPAHRSFPSVGMTLRSSLSATFAASLSISRCSQNSTSRRSSSCSFLPRNSLRSPSSCIRLASAGSILDDARRRRASTVGLRTERNPTAAVRPLRRLADLREPSLLRPFLWVRTACFGMARSPQLSEAHSILPSSSKQLTTNGVKPS